MAKASGSEKGTKGKKAAATKPAAATEARPALEALMRRLRRPRLEKVAAEIATFVTETGKPAARAAEELGTLEGLARRGLVDAMKSLLDAGVDPNIEPESLEAATQPRALGAVLQSETELDEATLKSAVTQLLAAGANADTLYPSKRVQMLNGRHTTALDIAVSRERDVAIQLLAQKASKQTRVHALNTFLERDTFRERDADWDARLASLLEVLPVDGVGYDGVAPLHVAAIRGDATVFANLQSHAKTKVPTIGSTTSFTLPYGTPPGGGMWPTLSLPAGATPLFVARGVRAKCEQTLALYKKQDGNGNDPYVAYYERLIAGHTAIIQLLEKQGVVDDTKQAALPAPLQSVLDACTRLATHLGIGSFADAASLIDPAGKGPFGFMLECVAILKRELDANMRDKLETTLVGKFFTGSISREVLLENEEDDLEETFGPDPKIFRVYLDNYPAKAKKLLENAKHYGVHGDGVLSLENSSGATKLWEIRPDEIIEHGEITQWLIRGVAELTSR